MDALPHLREDLSLYPGPADDDGAPTWTLHDPARNLFFQLPWASVETLSRWSLGSPVAVAAAVMRETTLQTSEADVIALAEFLVANQLTVPLGESDTDRFVRINAASKPSLLQWLLHHYLFIRVPLVRPNALLDATLPYVSWAFSRVFFVATVLALVLGLYLAGRQWDYFLASFVDLFTFQGAVLYGFAYLVVKVIHELGHAYTAKRFGCKVPTMGVALIVLWPVLYTDTNEAWKLRRRRQRVSIAAAGVATELAVAAWATLAWSLLPPGGLQTIAFLLATTTWISSVAINLSPFMRFDGYFLLMDLLGVPNLHARSFALARWKIREWLFALGAPAPEVFSRAKTGGLIAFAFFTWAYRLVLFLGIAVLVYHFFIKAVGILLFVVEMAWFVVRPVWSEVKIWIALRDRIVTTRRTRISLIGLAALIALMMVPWRGSVALPAVLEAKRVAIIYAPFAGQLVMGEIVSRQSVRQGDKLLFIRNSDLGFELSLARLRVASLREQVDNGSISSDFSSRRLSLMEELQRATASENGLRNQLAKQTLSAPFDGTVVDVDPDLRDGQWIGPGDPLFSVVETGAPIIEAYVTEQELGRVAVGAEAIFIAESLNQPRRSARVVNVDRSAMTILSAPILATINGGPIAVRPVRDALVPDQALYRVRLQVDGSQTPPELELRGTVQIDAPAESWAGSLWRSVATVVLRESGF